MAALTRSATEIPLIGFSEPQILGAKLPTLEQVLKVYFHFLNPMKSRESAKRTVREVIIFWEKAGIPIRDEQHCVAKLEKVVDEWKKIKKNMKNRKTGAQKKREEEFTTSLKQVFDISHANALKLMTSSEDKEFLLNHLQSGRPGAIMGFDAKKTSTEKRKLERKQKEIERKRQYYESQKHQGNFS